MLETTKAWSAIRPVLREFSFYEMKELVGLAGLDVTALAHLEQKAGGGASKGQLLTGIDGLMHRLREDQQRRVMVILVEEILRRQPNLKEKLDEYLGRLGWSLVESTLVPIDLFEPASLEELNYQPRKDLIKAAQRYRDGDLTGAISAACGAVDSVTSKIYELHSLGNPGQASFQERCKRALAACGRYASLEQHLSDLGWNPDEMMPFRKNLEGSLNQGAYVMQSLRSKMGDVHGSKPILRSLVFDCLKWAELTVHTLTVSE